MSIPSLTVWMLGALSVPFGDHEEEGSSQVVTEVDPNGTEVGEASTVGESVSFGRVLEQDHGAISVETVGAHGLQDETVAVSNTANLASLHAGEAVWIYRDRGATLVVAGG